MAVTTENGTEYGNATASPVVTQDVADSHGRIRYQKVTFAQGAAAGDANSLQNLALLPPGKINIIPGLCRLVVSAFGAARLLDVGYLAFTDVDGETVAASIDTILDGADVSAAAVLELGSGTNALPAVELNSRDGVHIQSKVLADTIPAAATITGHIAYTID